MFKALTTKGVNDFPSLLLHVDGGCEPKNPGGVATSGWVLYDKENPKQPLFEQGAVVQDGGPKATNNYGEYYALYLALNWLAKNEWKGELTIKADSKLLIEQVSDNWKVKAEHLKPLRTQIWELMARMNLHRVNESDPLPPEGSFACYLEWVRREFNEYANDLCREAYQEYRRGEISIS